MKKAVFLFTVFTSFTFCAMSQKSDSVIYISNHTATYVHFKGSPLIGADVGNMENIMFDTLPVSNGIMRLQAKKDFLETNILFVLKDSLIACRLKYVTTTPKTIYTFTIYPSKPDPTIQLKENAASLKSRKTAQLNNYEPNISVAKRQSDIVFDVSNLFVDSANLYVKCEISNKSEFDYKIDRVQFQTVNKKNVVKSAAISKITPAIMDEFNNPPSVPPHTMRSFIYSFNEFSPNEEEYLLISFIEAQHNSLGRNITLRLKQKNFRKAITIK